MVCGALRPGRQKGNARPGLGSHAREQRPALQHGPGIITSWHNKTGLVLCYDCTATSQDGPGTTTGTYLYVRDTVI